MTAWTWSPVWSYPEGIQEGGKVDEFTLSDTYKCEICYSPTNYGANTSYANICDCAGPWLFVGTQDYKYKILPNKNGKGKAYIVGAFGRQSEICPADMKISNGVEWLVVPNQQFTFGQPGQKRRVSWQLTSTVDPAPPKIAQRPVAYGGKFGKFWNDNLLYKVVWSCSEPAPTGPPTSSPPPTTRPTATLRPSNSKPTSIPNLITTVTPTLLSSTSPSKFETLPTNDLTQMPTLTTVSSIRPSISELLPTNAPTQILLSPLSSRSPRSEPNAPPSNAPSTILVSPTNLSGTLAPNGVSAGPTITAQPTGLTSQPTYIGGSETPNSDPTSEPTYVPSPFPTSTPTVTAQPTTTDMPVPFGGSVPPTLRPTIPPFAFLRNQPTVQPTAIDTSVPQTLRPTIPPFALVRNRPTDQPLLILEQGPTLKPSRVLK